jgi:hypothetical protein
MKSNLLQKLIIFNYFINFINLLKGNQNIK